LSDANRNLGDVATTYRRDVGEIVQLMPCLTLQSLRQHSVGEDGMDRRTNFELARQLTRWEQPTRCLYRRRIRGGVAAAPPVRMSPALVPYIPVASHFGRLGAFRSTQTLLGACHAHARFVDLQQGNSPNAPILSFRARHGDLLLVAATEPTTRALVECDRTLRFASSERPMPPEVGHAGANQAPLALGLFTACAAVSCRNTRQR
jgi:hypothetical protein